MSISWTMLLADSESARIDGFFEPIVSSLTTSCKSLPEAVVRLLAQKLSDQDLDSKALTQLMEKHLDQSKLEKMINDDLLALINRDFASKNHLSSFLFAHGFHALMSYRVYHMLRRSGQEWLPLWMHSRSCSVFNTDIHPSAQLGKSVVLDHGLGLVIGETVETGNDVFIFHNVTLGSTGKHPGKRHPTIGNNVVIGSGATILGNIEIADNSIVAAGALVLENVPKGKIVGGVPAKIIGNADAIQKT